MASYEDPEVIGSTVFFVRLADRIRVHKLDRALRGWLVTIEESYSIVEEDC